MAPELKAFNKAEFVIDRFGRAGFAYMSNSFEDLPVGGTPEKS